LNARIWQEVAGVAADVFGVDRASLKETSGPEQIEMWDSVEHLNLILAVEAHFSLQFDPEEMDQMTTLGRIAEMVEARAGGTSAK
jgi:acyl carrier protein